METVNLPQEWANEEVFDSGVERRNKELLLGTPFLITSLEFANGKSAPFVGVDAVDTNGEAFSFADGSSGVYRQLIGHLVTKGVLPEGTDGVKVFPEPATLSNVRLVIKRGLRKSEYEAPNGKPAVTYYIA